MKGPETVRDVMLPCGHQCISDSVIKTARSLYEQNPDMGAFLAELNSRRIGGGHLRIEGSTIIGIYKTCYCGPAKQAKGFNPGYCLCSAGWFRRLFGESTGKDVTVYKKSSILGGNDECAFEIVIG